MIHDLERMLYEVPHCQWLYFEPYHWPEHWDTVLRERYLYLFCPPGHCISCGARLGGGEDNCFKKSQASWEWSEWRFAEGHCGRCGYPGRAQHAWWNPETGEWGGWILNVILLYHPETLIWKWREPVNHILREFGKPAPLEESRGGLVTA